MIGQLNSAFDNMKISEMNSQGYQCVQVYTDGFGWYGLFVKKD